jgi:hypothetical protein
MKYRHEFEQELRKELAGAIGFAGAKWTARDVQGYIAGFEAGMTKALDALRVPDCMFNENGKQLN